MKSKLFLELTDKEEARLKWLIGFFVGHHIVEPTFINRIDWSEKEIVTELQGKYFKAIYDKFFNWLEMKSQKASKNEDIAIFKKLCNSTVLKVEIEALIFVKIPELAKKYNAEREGLTTRRQIKEQVSKEEWKEILVKFDNSCAYCGSQFELTKDHVLPISKGGKHEVNNLIPACHSCNSSKNDTLLDDWYPTKEFFNDKLYTKILNHIRG